MSVREVPSPRDQQVAGGPTARRRAGNVDGRGQSESACYYFRAVRGVGDSLSVNEAIRVS